MADIVRLRFACSKTRVAAQANGVTLQTAYTEVITSRVQDMVIGDVLTCPIHTFVATNNLAGRFGTPCLSHARRV